MKLADLGNLAKFQSEVRVDLRNKEDNADVSIDFALACKRPLEGIVPHTIDKTHVIEDLAQLYQFAETVATRLTRRQVLLLNGPMGAGKTQFTKYLVSILGGDETVSPSFAIHNQYTTKAGLVDHVDLFRLENDDELESTGFWDLFSSPMGCIVIEWAERLHSDLLPRTWSCLELTFTLPFDPVNAQVRCIDVRKIR